METLKKYVVRPGLGVGLGLSIAVLTACVSGPQSSRQAEQDSGPEQPVDVSHIPDAVPRVEPRTQAGNKTPYTVLGKTYYVMPDSDGYRERGMASWYGRKFHGQRTSNGEIYDMYGMTAAHKTLPIPAYVRVTNLDNGRSVIVRVNDRGPFHGDRIIDLTYAAAKKLDFEGSGTAPVEVEALDPASFGESASVRPARAAPSRRGGEPPAPAPKHAGGHQLPDNTYLQAGAFASAETANRLQARLQQMTAYPVFIQPLKELYRVRIGPITDNLELLDLQQLIQQQNLGVPQVVKQ